MLLADATEDTGRFKRYQRIIEKIEERWVELRWAAKEFSRYASAALPPQDHHWMERLGKEAPEEMMRHLMLWEEDPVGLVEKAARRSDKQCMISLSARQHVQSWKEVLRSKESDLIEARRVYQEGLGKRQCVKEHGKWDEYEVCRWVRETVKRKGHWPPLSAQSITEICLKELGIEEEVGDVERAAWALYVVTVEARGEDGESTEEVLRQKRESGLMKLGLWRGTEDQRVLAN